MFVPTWILFAVCLYMLGSILSDIIGLLTSEKSDSIVVEIQEPWNEPVEQPAPINVEKVRQDMESRARWVKQRRLQEAAQRFVG